MNDQFRLMLTQAVVLSYLPSTTSEIAKRELLPVRPKFQGHRAFYVLSRMERSGFVIAMKLEPTGSPGGSLTWRWEPTKLGCEALARRNVQHDRDRLAELRAMTEARGFVRVRASELRGLGSFI